MSALDNTVAPVPVRECVFVPNDTNSEAKKRGEASGDIQSKALDTYS